jgi:hypothetical protein
VARVVLKALAKALPLRRLIFHPAPPAIIFAIILRRSSSIFRLYYRFSSRRLKS